MQLFNTFKSATLALLIVMGLAIQSRDAQAAGNETLVVAGGCFWCVEADFEKVPGVIEAVSGFAGGSTANPTYKQVTRGGTGHYEVVEITFDPAKVSRRTLLEKFLRSVDPTDAGGQFCDRGESYRTAIFASGGAEKSLARTVITQAQQALGQNIVTPVLDAAPFYPAEAYHQNYAKQNGLVLTRFGPKRKSEAYKAYRMACGRDARVRQLWGDAAPFAGG